MSLARKSLMSTLYVVGGDVFLFGTALLLGIVRDRIIHPVYFGIYAAGVLYFSFLDRFTLYGFDEALRMSKEDHVKAGEMHRFLILTVNLFTLGLAIIAKFIFDYYGYFDNPLITNVLIFVAAMKLIEAHISTVRLLMEKDFRYARISGIRVLVKPLSLLLIIALAYFLNWTVYAIIYGVLFEMVFRFSLYWYANPFGRIKAKFHRDQFKYYLNFSPAWLHFIASWGSIIAMKFDDFMVEKNESLEQFAFYQRGFHWASMPTNQISHKIGMTNISVYHKLDGKMDDYRKAFTHFMGINLRMTCFVTGGLFLGCQEGVPLAWGKNWIGMAIIMQWLLVYCAFRPSYDLTGGALQGLGLQHFNNKINLVQAVLVIGLCIALIPEHGAIGAAIATSIAVFISTVITNIKITNILKTKWIQLYFPPYIMLVVGILISYYGVEYFKTEIENFALSLANPSEEYVHSVKLGSIFLSKCISFTVIYIGLLMLFEGKRVIQVLKDGVRTVKGTENEDKNSSGEGKQE